MISDENKLRFITGEYIPLPSTVVPGAYVDIRAQYSCPYDWEFGSILRFSDKLFGYHSSVDVYYFGSGMMHLFMSTTYNCKPKFESSGWEAAFDRLSQGVKDQIIEYCDWIASQEGRDFVKRIGKIKAFA